MAMIASASREISDHVARLQNLAWTGDAVLALWMRELMLVNGLGPDAQRGELFKYFTSNQFLSGFGRPTEVEAEVGCLYNEQGLEGAFAYLNERLLPVMIKRLANSGSGLASGKRRAVKRIVLTKVPIAR